MSEENETERSIYGRTESVFVPPKFNEGVPEDPRFLRVLAAIEVAVGVILFAFVFLGVMWQVLGRYLPALNWVGAGELALLSMTALTFITVGFLVGRNGHIVIEVFDRPLEGRKLFVALRVLSAAIMVAICLVLAYEAIVKIDAEWGRTTAAMHIPLGALYIFALVGFVSGALHSIWKIPNANRPERKLDISEMDA